MSDNPFELYDLDPREGIAGGTLQGARSERVLAWQLLMLKFP